MTPTGHARRPRSTVVAATTAVATTAAATAADRSAETAGRALGPSSRGVA